MRVASDRSWGCNGPGMSRVRCSVSDGGVVARSRVELDAGRFMRPSRHLREQWSWYLLVLYMLSEPFACFGGEFPAF